MIGNTRFVEWFKSTDDENRNDFTIGLYLKIAIGEEQI